MKKFIIQNKFSTKKISYAAHFIACVAFFCTLFLFAGTQNSLAKKSKSDFLAENKQELDNIEFYLNNIKNLTAKFVQKSEGGVVEGKFFLSRPGKMRVEYDNEPKVLIVVNGSVLTYKDLELDEISNLSTNTTPASFLTRQNISFAAKDVEVTNVIKNTEFTSVSVVKKNRQEAGEFTIIFKHEPFGFYKMEIKNDLGQITSITLRDVNFPEKINDDLFVIRNKNLPN